MNQEDREFIEDVGRWFYGQPPHTVNKAVGDVLAKMLVAVREKSRAINFVPRPPGSMPGWGWLISQGVKMAWRSKGSGTYDIARKAVALQYRSEYNMAQMGI